MWSCFCVEAMSSDSPAMQHYVGYFGGSGAECVFTSSLQPASKDQKFMYRVGRKTGDRFILSRMLLISCRGQVRNRQTQRYRVFLQPVWLRKEEHESDGIPHDMSQQSEPRLLPGFGAKLKFWYAPSVHWCSCKFWVQFTIRQRVAMRTLF